MTVIDRVVERSLHGGEDSSSKDRLVAVVSGEMVERLVERLMVVGSGERDVAVIPPLPEAMAEVQ